MKIFTDLPIRLTAFPFHISNRAETIWVPFLFGHLEMVAGVRTIVPVMATPIASTLSQSAAPLKVGRNLGI